MVHQLYVAKGCDLSEALIVRTSVLILPKAKCKTYDDVMKNLDVCSF